MIVDKMKMRYQSFAANHRGNVVIIFGIVLIPVMAMMGGALDYSRAYNTQKKLQASLDYAILAALRDTTGQQTAKGLTAFSKNFVNSHASAVTDPVFTSPAQGQLQATVSATVKTSILGIIGIDTISVSATSKGSSDKLRGPLCFMAMHPTRKHTLELDETVSVMAPNCHIYGNSSHFDDVVDPHTPANFLTGKSVQARGYGHNYLVNVSPPLEYAPELIPDPLANKTLPVAGACDFVNRVVSGGTATLNPGTYCGGLTIDSGANVTLTPGVYIVTGGPITITGSTVTGTGVTLAPLDTQAMLDWSSSTIRLVAPKTGQYAGIVVMGRAMTTHLLTASTVDLYGVVYLPNGDFIWSNTGTPTITANWTAWITDGISWMGDGVVNINFNLTSSDIPYPSELYVIPRPGVARLVN